MGTFGVARRAQRGRRVQEQVDPRREKQSITAGTKGNIIGISRQAIINDDMGAFDVARDDARPRAADDRGRRLRAARAQRRARPDDDGRQHAVPRDAQQHHDRRRARLGGDRRRPRRDGERRRTRRTTRSSRSPRRSCCCRSARRHRRARSTLGSTTSTRSNKFQIPNKVGGLFRDIVDTARITGTRRYLFADPGVAPTCSRSRSSTASSSRSWRCSRAGASTASSGRSARTTASRDRLPRRDHERRRATNSVAAGLPFELAVEGVFLVPKIAGVAWAEGALLYHDSTANNFGTVVSATTMRAGCAAVAALSGDTTGYVRLTGSPAPLNVA
jgi:predicted RecA/RadA family phage recombinase